MESVADTKKPSTDERYPEHAKLAALEGKNQIVGDFLAWCGEQGWFLCTAERKHFDPVFEPIGASIPEVLAQFFTIDTKKLEAEKRAMLDELRAHASKR